MKNLKVMVLLFFVVNSCSNYSSPLLIVQAQNVYSSTEVYKICESINGFEMYVSKEFKEEIKKKKVDKLFIEFNAKKIEVNLFNVFLSSNDSLMYQSPLTPPGCLSTFKANDEIFIDLITKDKKEFCNFIEKCEIEKCN